jgi:hypothetical protein
VINPRVLDACHKLATEFGDQDRKGKAQDITIVKLAVCGTQACIAALYLTVRRSDIMHLSGGRLISTLETYQLLSQLGHTISTYNLINA